MAGKDKAQGSGKPGPVRYFARDIRHDIDLLTFEVGEKVFGGRLASIARDARRIVGDMTKMEVLGLLLFADAFITIIADDADVAFIDQDDERHTLTRDVLDYFAPVDLLRYTARCLHDTDIVVSDSGIEGAPIHVTATRLCAAFALSQCAAAISHGPSPDGLYIGGAVHALQAVEACAIAKLLGGDDDLIGPLIVQEGAEENARKAAAARWASDPKALSMAEVRAEFDRWQDGQVEYKGGAAFARAMCLKHPLIEHEGSIQNKLPEWRASREFKS